MEVSHRKVLRHLSLQLRHLLDGHRDGLTWTLHWIARRCIEARGLGGSVPAELDGLPLWLADPRLSPRVVAPPDSTLGQCRALVWGDTPIAGHGPAGDDVFRSPHALGDAYQYWNGQRKARIFREVHAQKDAKIEGPDIIPATQLYTEPYMVRFLLQNSLGAAWKLMRPDTSLPDAWEYYIPQAARVDQRWADVEAKPVDKIRLLDPACGSGHFLVEAFDLLFDMYVEEGRIAEPEAQRPSLPAAQRPSLPAAICASILRNNLFGIDIDRKAVEIARVALWMKAAEMAPDFQPVPTNLAAVDYHLPGELEYADELGSLLRLDSIKRDTLESIDGRDPARAAEVRLLADLLARRYDVVVTNPPYIGKKTMGENVRTYLAEHYRRTKADTCGAFIERSLELTRAGGFTGMVSMKSWLYQAAFRRFRIETFRDFSLPAFADLGSGAFPLDLGLHYGVSTMLTCFQNVSPGDDREVAGVRVVDAMGPEQKAALLRYTVRRADHPLHFRFRQAELRNVPDSPFCYWLPQALWRAVSGCRTLRGIVKQGLATTDNSRFLRFEWEVPRVGKSGRWYRCAKGGTYRKWAGLDYVRVDWERDGAAIKAVIPEKYAYLSGWRWVAKNAGYYFREGLTYSYMCYGSLSARVLRDAVFEVASIGVFPEPEDRPLVHAVLNARTTSWILRAISQKHMFQAGMAERLPLPEMDRTQKDRLRRGVEFCIACKETLLGRDLREGEFDPTCFRLPQPSLRSMCAAVWRRECSGAALLHAVEAWLEEAVCAGYGLQGAHLQQLTAETGTPAGWHPLLPEYADLPPPADGFPEPPGEVTQSLAAHDRRVLSAKELGELRDRLRTLYEAGPGGRVEHESPRAAPAEGNDQPEPVATGGVPIPSETFLEELSGRLQLHPVSAYGLLSEGTGSDGWRCVPLEREIAADYLTRIVLCLLGHRWPREIASGASVADDIVPAGIVPLTEGTGEPTLADRVLRRMAADLAGGDVDGLGREFAELMGKPLVQWLATEFFKRHTRQFKRRPIAWQLQSGRFTARRSPVFACLVYYHELDADTLPKIRARYVVPLLRRLEAEQTERRDARRNARLAELRRFEAALEEVEHRGFGCDELMSLLEPEPLDCWCSLDGRRPVPESLGAFVAQEATYLPDPNDGVRVNVAPLGRAGLLAAPVLKKADLQEAIADRAAWRAARRKWCRQGKFSRPGWWP